MPLPLLLALFLAFGFEDAVAQAVADAPRGGAPASFDATGVAAWAVGQATLGVAAVGVVAFVTGRTFARRVARFGRPSPRARRTFALATRSVDVLGLAVYGGLLYELGWPGVVRLGVGDAVLLDEALILLPFLLSQAAGWWGLYAAERALRVARGGTPDRLGRHLWLKARQSMGMVLPVAAIYGLGIDLVRRAWPEAQASPWAQPVSLGAMGMVVLAMAPALVRIAWPTRPLPDGPLRDRLERLAGRVGFRCTDVLVWDTNRAVVNAGVTGALPWFRYVLLTDALVEHLSPHEVAAVFGHEIGHVAHRHLLYFGFFILGSLGLISVVEASLGALPTPGWAASHPSAYLALQSLGALAMIGGYFLVIFGFISRRFERQADVFGCRAVSCGQSDCPPHPDLDGRPGPADAPSPVRQQARRSTASTALCPVGIRIFVGALSSVAMLNGMQPRGWSWRHGSIVQRIQFLETLDGRPDAEQRFQSGVKRLRFVTGALILTALGAVMVNGYWGLLLDLGRIVR